MTTVLEALTTLTGKAPTEGHAWQANDNGGLHDKDTIASLQEQYDALWCKLYYAFGREPTAWEIHTQIVVSKWDVAKNGPWTKPPRKDNRPDLAFAQALDFYAKVLERPYDKAGMEHWREVLKGIQAQFQRDFIAGVKPDSEDWRMLKKKGMVR